MWKSLEDNFVTIIIFLAGIILSAGRLLQKYSSLEKRIDALEKKNSEALLLELKYNLKNLCEANSVKYIELSDK